MNTKEKFIFLGHLCLNPLGLLFRIMMFFGWNKWLNDRQHTLLEYRLVFNGRKCDLKEPKLFSEKLQWLKLYERKEIFHQMADKYDSKESFYNDDYKLKIKEESLLLEKVGWIKIKPNQVDKNIHYTNPRITYDGKYWYISLSYEKEVITEELTDEVIGVDVGIKNLATCSNGYIVNNINKTITMKKLEKRKKRLQRQISRKFKKNIKGKEYIKTKNIEKSLKKQKLIERRMSNIRMNQIHQATSTIIKEKPCIVVMEELDIQAMKKDKHLAYLLQGTYDK